MASFAKLLMDGGKWQGRQLVDEGYVRRATSKVTDNSEEKYASVFGHGYGYQIWQAPRGGFALVGMGCQLTVVLPDKQLIFVINSDTQGNESGYDLVVNGFLSFIADRMNDTPMAEAPSEYKRLKERIASLELHALNGEPDSPIKKHINGVTYACESNPLGMTEFTFVFGEDGGEFRYTNEQGDKVIQFGINKNAFGSFPELGYSDEVGREVTTDGFTYNDAVSMRFTGDSKLQIYVQIIDKYFGNFLATFAFVGDEVDCKFTATAENFLDKYRGRFLARKKK